jgi:hypothetical protein
MDQFFEDPDLLRLPPDQVRIIDLRAEPLPDGRRVRILLELTPFLNKPDGEISIFDSLGDEVAHVHFIETMLPKILLTLHLRGGKTSGAFKVIGNIYYSQSPFQAETGESVPGEDIKPALVDQKEVTFILGDSTVNEND